MRRRSGGDDALRHFCHVELYGLNEALGALGRGARIRIGRGASPDQ